MVGLPCFTWLHLLPSRICGDQLLTTEDKCNFHSRIILVLISSFRISTLAMSDELAQDDEDAEDYDLEALESRTRAREEDDNLTLVERHNEGPVGDDAIVFEIGDQDLSDDEDDRKTSKRHTTRHQEDRIHGDEVEREGLMNGDAPKDRD